MRRLGLYVYWAVMMGLFVTAMIMAYRLWTSMEIGAGIKGWWIVGGMLLVAGGEIVAQSQAWGCWLQPQERRLSWGEGLSLTAAAAFANVVFPLRSGLALRLAYMKWVHGVELNVMALGLGISYFVVLWLSAVIAGISMFDSRWHLSLAPILNQKALWGLVVVALLIALMVVFWRYWQPKLERLWNEFRHGWTRPKRLLCLHWWSLLGLAIEGLALWVALQIAGVSLVWGALAWMTAMMTLALFMSVTPAGLGVQEGVLAGGLLLLGIDIETAASVAVFRRVVRTIPILMIGLPSWWWLHRRYPWASFQTSAERR